MDTNAYGKSLYSRVAGKTDPLVNQMIMEQTEKSLLFYAEHPDKMHERIDSLKTEPGIEQALEKNASAIGLFGLFMAIVLMRRMFILLPVLVLGFLLQHALEGWCPPLPVLRRLGFRTKEEIQLELYGLRMLKGDFDAVPEMNSLPARDRVGRTMDLLRG